MKRLLVILVVCCVAAIAPWAALFAVNLSAGKPTVGVNADRCTRYCHNRGCPHEPVLPASLSSNEGLFGQTIRGLHKMGGATGLGRFQGYGAANLAVFVLLWPALMLALLAVVTWQRLKIRALQKEGGDG